MYEVSGVTVNLKNGTISGYEREVRGETHVLEAIAATEGTGDDAKTFVSLVNEVGSIHFTSAKDRETGETTGIGIHAEGGDARDVLIKGLKFLVKTLEDERAEVRD